MITRVEKVDALIWNKLVRIFICVHQTGYPSFQHQNMTMYRVTTLGLYW